MPGDRGDAQRATELLDLVGNDVHADTAACRLGHLARRRKPRRQDQLHDLVVAHLAVRLQHVEFISLASNGIDVEAAAIVGDVDDHFRTFAVQANRDASRRRLACLLAFLGRFHAMHDSVAQHVFEWRQHLLEHLPVEFARRALYRQLGPLAGLLRDLADEAR